MQKSRDVKVYIIGAGCSVDCGYPLARNFLSELDALWSDLITPNVQKIRRAVGNTAELLRKRHYSTIDELVEAINNGVLDEPGTDYPTTRRRRDDKVYDAKVATAALFLRLEWQARKTGVVRYSEFLKEILPDDDWRVALRESNCRVLTFNYDRLFEMAFLRRFGIDTGEYPLYGENVLNSGLGVGEPRAITFQPNKFSFLKLHGSVEFRARDESAEPHHYHNCHGPSEEVIHLDDEYFFGADGQTNPRNPRLEPLILFPFEKRFVAQQPKNGFPYRNYITKVWSHAATVLQQASEIWIIGYSFAATDRPALLQLLGAAKWGCRKMVIQNPDAEQICQMLKAKHPELMIPFKPYVARF